jgi:hypothetical protein
MAVVKSNTKKEALCNKLQLAYWLAVEFMLHKDEISKINFSEAFLGL